MSTNRRTWKNFEQSVAEFFGTNRTPLSGMCNTLTKADTLHERIFIECKLREHIPLFVSYREFQEERKKNQAPQVLRIKDFTTYLHDLWVFDYTFLPLLNESFKKINDTENKERTVIINSKSLIKDSKLGKTFIKLYKETEEKAKRENKIPIVAIKMKGQKGWLCIINPNYLSFIDEQWEQQKNEY